MLKLIPDDVKGKIVIFLDFEKGGWEHHYEIIGLKNTVGMLKGAKTRKSKTYIKIWHKEFPEQIFKTFKELNDAIKKYNIENKEN